MGRTVSLEEKLPRPPPAPRSLPCCPRTRGIELGWPPCDHEDLAKKAEELLTPNQASQPLPPNHLHHEKMKPCGSGHCEASIWPLAAKSIPNHHRETSGRLDKVARPPCHPSRSSREDLGLNIWPDTDSLSSLQTLCS